MPDEYMRSSISSYSMGGKVHIDGAKIWFKPNALNRLASKMARRVGRDAYDWALSSSEIVGVKRVKAWWGLFSYLGVETKYNETYWLQTWASNDEIEACITTLINKQ